MKKYLFIGLIFFPLVIFAQPSLQSIQGQGVIDVPQLIALQNKAKKNDADAQADLGEAYMNGSIGMLPNFQEAYYWLEKAAEKGEPIAYINLAKLYWRGNGVPQNSDKSYHYVKLAYKGLKKALNEKGRSKVWYAAMSFNLAELYLWGVDGIIDQDLPKAFSLYETSAQAGYVHSIVRLATMYRYGIGTDINPEKAYKWTEFLSERGLKQSQYQTGLDCLIGFGVKKDFNRSVYWLSLSAKNSYLPAIEELVALQERGLIHSVSDDEVKTWFHLVSQVEEAKPVLN